MLFDAVSKLPSVRRLLTGCMALAAGVFALEGTASAQTATVTLNATGSTPHTFFAATPQQSTVQLGSWFSPTLPTTVTLTVGVPKNVQTRLLSLTAIGTCANVPAESQSVEHTVIINGTTLDLPLQVTQNWLSATCNTDPQLRIHQCGSGCGPQNLFGTPASGTVDIGGGYVVQVTVLSTAGDFRQAGQGQILTTQLLLQEADSDGDGIPDNADVCPGGDDTVDLDGDGAPDDCDACPDDPDNDVDGDGVCGDVDNCPEVANSNQSDSNNNGLGDACDCVTVNQCVTIRRGELGAVEDTFLSGDSPNWAPGTEMSLWVGLSGGGNENRALFRFDLTSIPETATVTSAQLTLAVAWNEAATGSAIHEVLGPWSEASTRLSNFTAPVDPLAAANLPAGFGLRSVDLTELVSTWVNFPATNYGIQLRDGLPTRHLVYSSEASLGNRPRLGVCYSVCQ
ncbi:MAG: DNRLRE domain-containing protein [Polyangiaceae bacterium]|nr:DNRLRE domain-containing protein [Polyangiaceae bacterium]